MRFAFVFDGLGYGGIERVGVDYCNALAKRGHEVHVVNLVPSQNEFVPKLNDGIDYIEKPFSKSRAPERYCSLVKRAAWGRYAYPIIFAGASFGLEFSKPLLRHGLPSVDVAIAFSGHYNDLTFVGCDCLRGDKKIAWLHGTINGYALISDGFLNLYEKFDGLVCLSDEGLEEFKYANKYLDFNIKKIYNPVPIRKLSEDDQRAHELVKQYGDFILSVGRFEYPKDFDTLIKAMKVLRDEYGIDKKCILVGDGPDLTHVKNLTNELGLDDLVVFAGYQSDPGPYYDACSIFVLSSINEGLPTVILEAMAHGKPVVSTNTPGGREILRNDQYGFICGIQDEKDMAYHIATLVNDPQIANAFVKSSFKRLVDFKPSTIINCLLNYVTNLRQ